MICDSPVLAYYDVNKPTVVSSDASSYGIAGVIMQQHGEQLKPVAFCYRTLTNAERSYAQIEKNVSLRLGHVRSFVDISRDSNASNSSLIISH